MIGSLGFLNLCVLSTLLLAVPARAWTAGTPPAAADVADLEEVIRELDLKDDDEIRIEGVVESNTIAPEASAEAPAPLTLTPTETARLKIIGRGIQDRESGDSIALGCVDDSCTRLRNVYFNSKTYEATFFGRVFELQAASPQATRQELKRKVREINREYKKYKQDKTRSPAKSFLKWLGFCSAFGGGMYLAINYLPAAFMTSFGLSVVTFGVVPFAGIILLTKAMYIPGKSGMVSEVFADDKGWNWAENPKKVSPRVFRLYDGFAKAAQ